MLGSGNKLMRNNVRYNQENRKLNLIRNYEELLNYTSQLFWFNKNIFHFIYFDEDNDPITVNGQDEFEIALDFFKDSIPQFEIKINSRQSEIVKQAEPVPELFSLEKIKKCNDSDYEDDEVLDHQFKDVKSEFESFNPDHQDLFDFNNNPIINSEEEKISELHQEKIEFDKLGDQNQLIDWPNDDIIHDGYECTLCSNTPIYGVRYRWIQWDDFTLWDEWELTQGHDHPLIKFKTNQDEVRLIEDLQAKYLQEDIEEVKMFTPKVIDSSLHPPKYLSEIPEYAKITSDFAKFKSTLVEMMPRTNYTIDQTTTSILLTIKLKKYRS